MTTIMNEVADIFREYGKRFKEEVNLPGYIINSMNAIVNCRTSALGGHVDECDKCGHKIISYNSCRNRHCPKCQGSAREKWINKMENNLLPLGYFHIVLTLPHELNDIVLRNKEIMYGILFKAGSETLLELGRDKKHLGAQIGFTAILHTWGQNLMDHNHLHCIVPAGGLSLDGESWVDTKKEDFFIHVNVLSDLFKKKFMHYLLKVHNEDKLKFMGKIEYLKDENEFKKLRRLLYEKRWNIYCKPPFGGPEQVLEYIGRYTHRVAISNSRIIKVENGTVTFKWRDYSDSNKNKIMTLSAHEFIRRFLLHILPDRFMKIRHYGILGNRNIKTKLDKCKNLLIDRGNKQKKSLAKVDLLEEIESDTNYICPSCNKGIMRKRHEVLPDKHGPPKQSVIL